MFNVGYYFNICPSNNYSIRITSMALKVIELKVGNWVDYNGDFYQVTSISNSGKVGISRKVESGVVSLEAPIGSLNGIKFTKEILYQLEGFKEKEYQEKSNIYLISLLEDTGKPDSFNPRENLIIDWSICIKELEGSWWVNIEDSTVTFETMGEGEFYFLHDLQNIVSSFIYQEIVWKNLK